MSPKPPPPAFDPELKVLIVPGKTHTAESLAILLGRKIKERGITRYRIMRTTGLTMGAVNHFFQGYKSTTEAKEGTVKDPLVAGRVTLATFLKIVQGLGYDVEIVAREKPGRQGL